MTAYLRLRQWLADNDVTQAELARRCQYDPGNLHRVLNGKLRPTLVLAAHIERETGGKIMAADWVEASVDHSSTGQPFDQTELSIPHN